MSSGAAVPLFGRTKDVDLVCAFVDRLADGGGSLLISGDAGVGKTALLDIGASHAETAGARVLRAAGAEFETELSFSGLNQILYPLLDGVSALSAHYREALNVALGLDVGPSADRLVLSNAVLALLRDASTARPALMVVDDLPWLDRASALVLASVVRRLSAIRVSFLGSPD